MCSFWICSLSEGGVFIEGVFILSEFIVGMFTLGRDCVHYGCVHSECVSVGEGKGVCSWLVCSLWDVGVFIVGVVRW